MNNRKITFILVLGLLILGTVGTASAHFTMLFPGDSMDVDALDYIAKEGETKKIRILWGHPCEHVLFDCPVLPEVYLRDPNGVITTLNTTEISVEGVKAYEISFLVEERGDYIVHAKLNVSEHELIDHTKAVIHCGEEEWNGWDAILEEMVEVVPYTRPYGLEEGFTFTGNAMADGTPLTGATVEVEKYYNKSDGDEIVEAAERIFSDDPPMMFTRVVNTDANGDFALTLDEAGIWFIGAYDDSEGFEKRGVMIVPVVDTFPAVDATVTDEAEDSPSQALVYVAIILSIVSLIIGVFTILRRENR